MPADKLSGISCNNIKINSMVSGSGVFAGFNTQYCWSSEKDSQASFGRIIGEANSLDAPCSVTTDSGSSAELLKYFQELVGKKIGKRGV